jgi:hypothetical protein
MNDNDLSAMSIDDLVKCIIDSEVLDIHKHAMLIELQNRSYLRGYKDGADVDFNPNQV